MRIGKLPLLAAGLLVAGALALASTMAVAQGKADDNPGGSGDLPQSRSPDRGSPLSPLPEPPDGMDDPEGGEDEAPGGQTCPDRGNTLELII